MDEESVRQAAIGEMVQLGEHRVGSKRAMLGQALQPLQAVAEARACLAESPAAVWSKGQETP
jgi:hypothetical protein